MGMVVAAALLGSVESEIYEELCFIGNSAKCVQTWETKGNLIFLTNSDAWQVQRYLGMEQTWQEGAGA